MERIALEAQDVVDLANQLKATPADGRVYITVTATGGVLADWLSGREQQTFNFDVGKEPGGPSREP
jgi:hypothetical protein